MCFGTTVGRGDFTARSLPNASRIAEGAGSGRNVARDHAARPELQARRSPFDIARMVGREYLYSRLNLRSVANGNLHHVEDNAVEVQEYIRAKTDIESVVAVE